MTRRATVALVIVVAAVGVGGPAFGQVASFRGLGDLPGGGMYSEGYGVSGNGVVAVGASVVGGSGLSQIMAGFAFTGDGVLEPVVDQSGSGATATAAAVSMDGGVIVGWVDYGAFSPLGMQGFVWTAANGWSLIGDLPGGVSQVPKSSLRAISANGQVAAGTGESASGNEAFRYSRETGALTPLGDLTGGAFGSFANGMSADGGTIVGVSYSGIGTGTDEQQAFKWTSASGMVGLGFLTPAAGIARYSVAEAASADGSVIVGESRSANSGNGGEACRWVNGGPAVGIGDLPGGAFQSWAYGVSADGSVVVGRASVQGPCGPFGCGSAGRAFVWDSMHGMRDLQAVLSALGVAGLDGWALTEARGVSADGTVIVGTGTDPAGAIEAWMAVLPRLCLADYDGNGLVQPADVNAFVNAWFSGVTGGTLSGDFDGNGRVEPADVNAFVNAWFGAVVGGGCP